MKKETPRELMLKGLERAKLSKEKLKVLKKELERKVIHKEKIEHQTK